MANQIFINLAVSNLEESAKFYTSIGFNENPQFSDDTAKCMVWSENIFLMILSEEKFKSFATKPLADTKNNLAALYALAVDSVEKVHEIMENGLHAGGIEPKPMQDHGFMQLRNLEDPDGHTWEIFYMDMSKMGEQ